MTYPLITATPLPHVGENTEQWHKQRSEGIGGSEASTIAGMNPYESPYHLWAIKTGKVPAETIYDERTTELFEWGHLLEPVVRDKTAEYLGIGIMKPQVGYHHPEREWQRCNLDGWSTDSRVYEGKNVSNYMKSKWDDAPADHAEIQLHHNAMVVGATHGIVGALIGGNEYRCYEVEINPDICDMLLEMETRFWEYHVMRDIPPQIDDHDQTKKTLFNMLRKNPDIPVEIPISEVQPLIDQYRAHEQSVKYAEQQKNIIKNQLLQMMVNHEGTSLVTGDHTWARIQSGRINPTVLQQKHPEIYKQSLMIVENEKIDTDFLKTHFPEAYEECRTRFVKPIL